MPSIASADVGGIELDAPVAIVLGLVEASLRDVAELLDVPLGSLAQCVRTGALQPIGSDGSKASDAYVTLDEVHRFTIEAPKPLRERLARTRAVHLALRTAVDALDEAGEPLTHEGLLAGVRQHMPRRRGGWRDPAPCITLLLELAGYELQDGFYLKRRATVGELIAQGASHADGAVDLGALLELVAEPVPSGS